jgi:lipopolysaccharide/colanic/teichoic acid biosynthesis glycosyltransferase
MIAERLVPSPDMTERRPYDGVKRLMDLGLSAVGLLILSPLLVSISALITFGSPGGVWYRGVRVGRQGRLFRIWKFRTMRTDVVDGPTSTAEDDPRITSVGHVLRRYKLDELPQLLNVLGGEMSLVGPRPQVPWAVETYTPIERRVLTVRPGISDWASIRFQDEGAILKNQKDPDEAYMRLIHPEKMRLALEYVERRSLRVDLSIILKTLAVTMKP